MYVQSLSPYKVSWFDFQNLLNNFAPGARGQGSSRKAPGEPAAGGAQEVRRPGLHAGLPSKGTGKGRNCFCHLNVMWGLEYVTCGM